MKKIVREQDQLMASIPSDYFDDGNYDQYVSDNKQNNDPLLFQYYESIPLFQSGYELHTSCSSSILPTSSQSSEKSQEILPLSQSTAKLIQSSNNSTDRKLKVSDFYSNGTWHYGFDDLHSAVKNSTNNLVPASDVDIDGFYSALAFNAVVFMIFMLSYEILRRLFPNVYASRKKQSIPSFQPPSLVNKINEGGNDDDNLETGSDANETEGTPVAPDHYWTDLPDINDLQSPFQWVGPVYSVPWHRVRQVAGLDAYFFLRYIRMCLRITAVSAFWGIVILWPIYATGSNKASGWYHFSLANVTTGSWRIWAGTSFLYMFSLYVFFVMKQEYKHYIELRLEFLGKGERGIHPQHHYSVMVERIPQQLRSDAALFGYFNRLFPGKVHSANVLLNLPEMDALSKRKKRVQRRLEKSIAYYYATDGKRPTHIMGRPRFMCMGIEGAPSEIPCCLCCQESGKVNHLEGYDLSVEPKRGDRVDSITYYTHDLMQCNSDMFEMQKQKAIIAERGNVAITSMGWFEKVDIFTDTAVSRLNEEYIPGRHNSEPLGEVIGISSGGTIGGYGGLVPRKPNLFHFKRSWIDTGGKALKESSIQRLGEVDAEKSQLYGSIIESDEQGERSEEGRKKKSVIGRKTAPDSTTTSSDVATLMEQTPNPFRSPKYQKKIPDALNTSASSLGAVIFESTSDDMGSSSSGSKDQRLIDEDFMEEGDNYEAVHDFALSTERAIQKRGFISKLVGRLGVDFALYGVKLLNRQLAKFFDRVVGTSTMSSTGFVTFLDLSSLTCATSAPLTHKPNTLNVKVAPEPMDIKWHNAHVPTDVADRRAYNANLFLAVGALLWSIPLAAIQALASAEKLAQIPGMDWILTYNSGSLKVFINVYLPVVALLALIMLLPIIFEAVAVQYEKRKTKSGVERSIIDRYFYYQLANIYITVTAGSLWNSLSDIISSPSEVFEILGKTLPMVVGYFVSLLSTKILAGLPMIILRPGALSRYFFLRLTYKKSHLTQKELDRIYREEELLYGWEYPTLLLVLVICFTYVSISPVILIFGALYFIGSLLVHKKQVLYVYTPQYESGGSMFPLVCDRTLIGLLGGQLIYIGYIVVIRSGYYQIIVLFPLVYITIFMMNYFRQHYADPSDRLTLERAKELDEFLDKKASLAMNEPLRPGLGARLLEQIFTKEHYKQSVMTESAGEPVSYRPGVEDELTREAIEKIRASRDRLTEDMNVYPYGASSEEAAT